MTNRIEALPEFSNPPLDEVALGTQFERLDGLLAPHMGAIWRHFRAEFPRVEQHAPLPPSFERFPPVGAANVLQFRDAVETPRCWFVAADDSQLIQLQQDRFLHNWRRRGDQYPRFPSLREHFAAELNELAELVAGLGLGPLHHNQCEVTYTNVISGVGGEDPHRRLERLTPLLTGRMSDDFLPRAESSRVATTFVMETADEKPAGRLHLEMLPGFTQPNREPVVGLRITARGAPPSADTEGVLRFLDLGHEWVVRAFASVTSPEMHKEWGRSQ